MALEVEEPKPKTRLYCAWRPRDAGKALKWWVARLEEPGVRERLLSRPGSGSSAALGLASVRLSRCIADARPIALRRIRARCSQV